MKTETAGGDVGGQLEKQQVEELVRSLGVVVNNTFLYGEDHGVTTESMERCFPLLSGILDAAEKITLARNENDLMVNHRAVEHKNPLVDSLIQRLADIEISNITLIKGLTRNEFDTFVGILTAKPDEIAQLGGLAEVLNRFNVEHVQTRVVAYVEIDQEKEEVIAKKEKEDLEAEASAERRAVRAFLEGTQGAGDDAAMTSLRHVASDSETMSEVIVGVADDRQKAGAAPEQGEAPEEEFAELVAECVKKAYGEIVKGPGLKTQKAKKELAKTLEQLEKQLVTRMQEVCEDVSEEDRHTVADAIEGLIDELKIDSLASEYMKKRNAIEANEKKILRYLKAKGLHELAETDLETKLAEAGLSTEDWQRLLIKSGISGAGTLDEDSALAAVGHIAILMAGLDKAAGKAGAAEGAGGGAEDETVAETVRKVGAEVTALATSTGQKIQRFIDEVRQDQEAAEAMESAAMERGTGPRMSRRKMLDMLAEIVQELCQPLSVINTTVGMLQSGRLGEVSDAQERMLTLADDSGRKLQVLVDHLLEISGLPTTLSPDTKIQSALYD